MSIAAAAVLAATFAALPSAPPQARADDSSQATAAPTLPRQSLADFERFVVHLLVLPLVDDSSPPRWQAFGIDWVCRGGGEVRVDGLPLVDGAVLPAAPFELRWTLHRCPPLDDAAFLVEGVVTMMMTRDGDELRAASVDVRLLTAEGGVERRIARPFAFAQPLPAARLQGVRGQGAEALRAGARSRK